MMPAPDFTAALTTWTRISSCLLLEKYRPREGSGADENRDDTQADGAENPHDLEIFDRRVGVQPDEGLVKGGPEHQEKCDDEDNQEYRRYILPVEPQFPLHRNTPGSASLPVLLSRYPLKG